MNNKVTKDELKLLLDQISVDSPSDYDEGREGWGAVEADGFDQSLTSTFEYAANPDEGGPDVRRRITAMWRLELVNTKAVDFHQTGEEWACAASSPRPVTAMCRRWFDPISSRLGRLGRRLRRLITTTQGSENEVPD